MSDVEDGHTLECTKICQQRPWQKHRQGTSEKEKRVPGGSEGSEDSEVG